MYGTSHPVLPQGCMGLCLFSFWFYNMRELEVGHCPVSHRVFAMGSSAMIISLTLKMTSTRFHVTVERWIAGSGWTECIPCYLSGRLVPRKRRLNTSLNFTDRKIFCFLTFWKTASGSSGSSAFVWRKHSTEGASWGCLAVHWGQQSHRMVQHFFFLFLFFPSFCFPVGGFCFVFVLLVSLRRNFYWGKEPVAALPQGGGLPMNVRLKSPAKGAVQSAGHALLTGAGPEFN